MVPSYFELGILTGNHSNCEHYILCERERGVDEIEMGREGKREGCNKFWQLNPDFLGLPLLSPPYFWNGHQVQAEFSLFLFATAEPPFSGVHFNSMTKSALCSVSRVSVQLGNDIVKLNDRAIESFEYMLQQMPVVRPAFWRYGLIN